MGEAFVPGTDAEKEDRPLLNAQPNGATSYPSAQGYVASYGSGQPYSAGFSQNHGFAPVAPAYPMYPASGIQPMSMEAQFRTWKAHYCCFFGDCTSVDSMSCLLSCCCPCFAFGQNMARALNLSWRDECLKFFGLMLVFSLLNIVWRSTCHPVYADDLFMGLTNSGDLDVEMDQIMVGWQCNNTVTGLTSLAMFAVAVVGAVWAGGRRTAIRERFGIPGSRAWDAIGWLFCHPCSLSQETRTLAHNNVVDGVWHGPLVAPPVPGSLPGVPARMDVWGRIAPTPLGHR